MFGRVGVDSRSIRSGENDAAFAYWRTVPADKWDNLCSQHTELTVLSLAALSRFRLRQVGFVFQFSQLITSLTTSDNIKVLLRFERYVPK